MKQTLKSIKDDLQNVTDCQQLPNGIQVTVTNTNFWRIAEILELPEESCYNETTVAAYFSEAEVGSDDVTPFTFMLTDDDLKSMPALLEA